jgi:hypothetical protein
LEGTIRHERQKRIMSFYPQGPINACCGRPVQVLPPCPPICPPNNSNSFQNCNLNGIGVFDNVDGTLVSFRGIVGDGSQTVCTLDAVNHSVIVSLLATASPPQVFANATARAAAVPKFVGQLGVETDNLTPWIATGTFAGDWQAQFLTNGVVNTLQDTDSETIFLAQGGAQFSVTDQGGNQFAFTGGTGFECQGTWQFVSTCTVSFSASVKVNFVGGSLIQSAGTTIPGNSVLITGAAAGELTSALINTYLSSANVQTGYTLSNGSTNRTFDVSTIGGSYSQTVPECCTFRHP